MIPQVMAIREIQTRAPTKGEEEGGRQKRMKRGRRRGKTER
jgi:hypothetical protein